jgi:hypothetical protein
VASDLASTVPGFRRPRALPTRVRSLTSDPVTVALVSVFVLAAAFYVWRATFAAPLSLYGGQSTQYNQLADAFIHFHLWVVHVPEGILGAGNPYNPAERPAFLFNYPDYSLYGQYLYIIWGPVPVLVWLVPLHLLGFEPSASVIMLPFVIVGLAFALATLRLILRQIGDVKLWLCVVAAFTLACASVMPYTVRFPIVYYEEIASAWCFAMIGVWFAVSAVVDRRSSFVRLGLMSLAIGLATGSRPTLGLLGLLLVPVYLSLRSAKPRRRLLTVLTAPFGACVLLLGAYDLARFGNPLQWGAKYQINGISTYTAHFGRISFIPPGLWAYLFAPPRLSALFPFILIVYPQVSYPLHLPAYYNSLSEETGGLLPMVPIVIFLAMLPWMWRRRSSLLGALAPLLMVLAGVGLTIMLFVAYEFYTSTERYETDYMTLLLFGAIAVWLALCRHLQGRRRWLVRTGGALLAVWSCLAGLALSYQEIERDPGTWRTLVNLGSPLSTVIATLAGRPVLAEVYTPNVTKNAPTYGGLGAEITGFSLTARDQAVLTIVSPDSRADALAANTVAGPALEGSSLEIRIEGPGHASHFYRVPGGGRRVRIPIRLERGVNEIVLSPAASAGQLPRLEPEPESQALMSFAGIALASR